MTCSPFQLAMSLTPTRVVVQGRPIHRTLFQSLLLCAIITTPAFLCRLYLKPSPMSHETPSPHPAEARGTRSEEAIALDLLALSNTTGDLVFQLAVRSDLPNLPVEWSAAIVALSEQIRKQLFLEICNSCGISQAARDFAVHTWRHDAPNTNEDTTP